MICPFCFYYHNTYLFVPSLKRTNIIPDVITPTSLHATWRGIMCVQGEIGISSVFNNLDASICVGTVRALPIFKRQSDDNVIEKEVSTLRCGAVNSR